MNIQDKSCLTCKTDYESCDTFKEMADFYCQPGNMSCEEYEEEDGRNT